MNRVQTDNSYFDLKIKLRLDKIPKKKKLTVLDFYHGKGKIWNKIKAEYKGDIQVLGIDKKDGNNLKGDNLKFVNSLDLNKYDVFDLDAYGIPYKQLKEIFKHDLKNKCMFVTFIQSLFGGMNKELLLSYGYTEAMIKKCRSLFNKKGIDIFKHFLYSNGIKHIEYYNVNRKYYMFFKLNPE